MTKRLSKKNARTMPRLWCEDHGKRCGPAGHEELIVWDGERDEQYAVRFIKKTAAEIEQEMDDARADTDGGS
jgi:hypothetical protein